MGIALVFSQDNRIAVGNFTYHTGGYKIITLDATGPHQGGIALVWVEDHPVFEVEVATIVMLNVLTFKSVTGGVQWFVVW